jgi:deoxyribodipyrimidine photolyase-related protein
VSRRARSPFARELAARATDPAGRRWLFVPYDQLHDGIGPLAREDPRDLGIVLVEAPWKAARRPYHRQKLALVLANLRHFALEQAARGVAVRHVVSSGSYADALAPLAAELGPLRCMEPAERELRVELAPLAARGAVSLVPHEGWLTSREDFARAFRGGRRWRMDAFYRHVRRRSGILMDGETPAGGRFSFDVENRRPWRGEPPAAIPPRFLPDAVTEEVGALVERRFADHPGRVDLGALPATAADAEALWAWARRDCLPWFGPFEDAMSTASTTLFHTRVSALLNLHRLLPARVVADALALPIPLASQEGFVRQVLGWREFVRHVHVETDGFRRPPDGTRPPVAERPGDGGWSRWSGRPWPADAARGGDPDGGARPDFLGAGRPVPPAFWGAPSGLACLDRVVADVWAEAYGHHITRLMVLANLATLLGVDPRELADWFWVAYADAYDWVVEPNVLGMGSFALGDRFTTKPYVSGAAYIDRMSDHCRACAFSPKRDCPVTSLYWNFLAEQRERLAGNPRLAMPLRSAARRTPAQRLHDAQVSARVRERLGRGEPVVPERDARAADRRR